MKRIKKAKFDREILALKNNKTSKTTIDKLVEYSLENNWDNFSYIKQCKEFKDVKVPTIYSILKESIVRNNPEESLIQDLILHPSFKYIAEFSLHILICDAIKHNSDIHLKHFLSYLSSNNGNGELCSLDATKILKKSIKNNGFFFEELRQCLKYKFNDINSANLSELICAAIENENAVLDRLIQCPKFIEIESYNLSRIVCSAIRAKSNPILSKLISHNKYNNLSESCLSNAISTSIKKDGFYLEKLCEHPNFKNLDVHWLSNIIVACIEKGEFALARGFGLEVLVKHNNFKKLRAVEISSIIETIIDKGDMDSFNILKHHPKYDALNCYNLTCVIIKSKSKDGFLFDELRHHPNFNKLYSQYLVHLINYSIKLSDEQFFHELIQNPNYENLNYFDLAKIICTSLANNGMFFNSLIQHHEFKNTYMFPLKDMIEVSIQNNGIHFETLIQHRNFENLDEHLLNEIMKTSIRNNGIYFEILLQHPKYNFMSEVLILELINSARRAHSDQKIFQILECHPTFLAKSEQYEQCFNNSILYMFFNKKLTTKLLYFDARDSTHDRPANLILEDQKRFELFTKSFCQYIHKKLLTKEQVRAITCCSDIISTANIFVHEKNIKFNYDLCAKWICILRNYDLHDHNKIHEIYEDYMQQINFLPAFNIILDRMSKYIRAQPESYEKASHKTLLDAFHLSLSLPANTEQAHDNQMKIEESQNVENTMQNLGEDQARYDENL